MMNYKTKIVDYLDKDIWCSRDAFKYLNDKDETIKRLTEQVHRLMDLMTVCDICGKNLYEKRVKQYEDIGLTTSDAQAVVDAEDLKRERSK
jgi:recombinational DNA repair protein RecR